ncbi:cytochrome P460 [Thiogranum longum]|uniref:Cytochrome P460 n=1 Tax=Thiogranum longum TaxID=1537524 RepID=A0A4V2PGQ0_9GAMM|nr:cytochrome P460 family protein [Thiogranum longum]TCK17716.1 cytochrome P460 [Thiogranum longum]
MKLTRKGWRSVAFPLLTLLGAVTLYGCQTTMQTMGMGPPMGSSTDVADSQDLWKALQSAHLVGPQAEKSSPYMGTPPHGKVLETLHQQISVNGHSGIAIVKRNYNGPDVSISNVDANRAKYLKAVTVMFKREAGYDPEDKDWFWAKYTPDGGLHVKEKMGMKIKLAGRVAKGKPEGCISCHRGAPGGDFVFANGIQVR